MKLKTPLTTNLVLFFLFFFCISGWGQQEQLERAKAAVDTLFFSDKEKALEIAEATLPEALLSKDTMMITYFLDQAGELNRMKGKYELALEQLHQCLDYKVNWKDLKDLSLTHNNIGKTHYSKGNYDLAVRHFIEALKLMEQDHNLIGQAFYLNNLAAVYDVQKNYNKALEYYEKSLTIKKKLNDQNGIAATSLNIGITYFNLGDIPRSLEFNQKAYNIYKTGDNDTKTVRAINNIGECYTHLGNYEKALRFLNLANQKRNVLNSEELKYKIVNNLAELYLSQNGIQIAQAYSDTAFQIVQKSLSYQGMRDVYQMKSRIAKKEEKFELSLLYLEKSQQYNDSLINETNLNKVAEMTAKYEYEKNKRKISEQKLLITEKEKIIEEEKIKVVYWIIASFVLIAIVIIIGLLLWNHRKNAKLIQGQLVLIEQQNNRLEEINANLKTNLNKLHLSLEEKEQLIDNVLTRSRTKELPPELLSLSKREMEVLSHLALGWTDEQLAQKLFVSKSTIKTHLRKIYSKLLVRGRAEAVAIAHKHGLIGGQ